MSGQKVRVHDIQYDSVFDVKFGLSTLLDAEKSQDETQNHTKITDPASGMLKSVEFSEISKTYRFAIYVLPTENLHVIFAIVTCIAFCPKICSGCAIPLQDQKSWGYCTPLRDPISWGCNPPQSTACTPPRKWGGGGKSRACGAFSDTPTRLRRFFEIHQRACGAFSRYTNARAAHSTVNFNGIPLAF